MDRAATDSAAAGQTLQPAADAQTSEPQQSSSAVVSEGLQGPASIGTAHQPVQKDEVSTVEVRSLCRCIRHEA